MLFRLFPFVTVYDVGDEKSESPSTCNSKSDELSPPHALGSDHDRVKLDDVSDETDGVPGDDGALANVRNATAEDHEPLPPALTARTRA